MAGIQISGLLSDSAFDWKTVVDQLMAVSSTSVTKLQSDQTKNTDKVTALNTLNDGLLELQTASQALRDTALFQARGVSSDRSNTSWKALGTSGAPIGSYKVAVSQLATGTRLQGGAGLSQRLAASSDVSALTLASLPISTALTASSFTVNGKQVSVAMTDSLADVFAAISTATGGDVTASYNSTTDKITLASSNGELVLGAANDSSNFISALKLANNGTNTSSSTGTLAALQTSRALANLNLSGAITAVDGSGNGTFSINGVNLAYNVNTDTLGTVISRINQSSAGVNARYDASSDRMVITNSKTGDIGLGLSETGTGLLSALNLTTGTSLTRGKNAQFTVNDGATLTSESNTLDASVHGITGLSLTVNTTDTQTISVSSDTTAMQTTIQSFLDKFNTVQELIEADTKTTTSGGTVKTSILSDNREVQQWARQLRSAAFGALTSITGSVTRLDHLGIDFDSTSSNLIIKDASKLATALSEHPDDVANFFQSGSNGFVSRMNTLLATTIRDDLRTQTNYNSTNTKLGEQITTLQRRLEDERTRLTSAFLAMQDAQATAQSQAKTLTNAFFKQSNSN